MIQLQGRRFGDATTRLFGFTYLRSGLPGPPGHTRTLRDLLLLHIYTDINSLSFADFLRKGEGKLAALCRANRLSRWACRRFGLLTSSSTTHLAVRRAISRQHVEDDASGLWRRCLVHKNYGAASVSACVFNLRERGTR